MNTLWHTQKVISFGDLFCGCGGFSIGAAQAGWSMSWGLDYDRSACCSHESLGLTYCADVRGFDFRMLTKPDVLLIGLPCNDFSAIGKRKGVMGEYGSLYADAAKAVDVLNPRAFILENVPGLSGDNLSTVVAALSGRHKVVTTVLDAADFGVPQFRARRFIVGIRGAEWVPPSPSSQRIPASILDNTDLTGHPHHKPKFSPRAAEILKHIPPGGNVWHENVPVHLQPKTNCRLSVFYRRLHPDFPSPTLTARGGGGTHGYHHREDRSLTNAERMVLSGFPLETKLYGGYGDVRAQIGMAVPPPLAKAVCESVGRLLT